MIRASSAIRTSLLCSIGAALLYSRKYDEAIEQYKKTMHMDRNIKMVRLDLASAYEQEKMYPEAIAQWQGVIALGDPALAAAAGEIHRNSGFQASRQNLLDHLPKDPLAGEQPYRMRSC
jgi:tetratricopeptide (TPR) repeat protein